MGDSDVWPVFLDMSRDDCKRILRRLELEAYSNLVSVLRAQGSLTASKRRLLHTVAQTLGISEERHKAECRRAVNSEKLSTIAKHMGGTNSGTEWAIEGRRLVPLLPRLVPQTAFTSIADKVANMAMTEGAKLPMPTPPVKRILSPPPIDATYLEPNVPEASKTSQVSSGSPLMLSVPSGEMYQHLLLEKPHSPNSAEAMQLSHVSPLPLVQSQDTGCGAHVIPTSISQGVLPSPDFTTQVQIKQEVQPTQISQTSADSTVSSNVIQASGQTLQPQVLSKSQVVLLVKKEDKSQDERLSRKRPRSASLDVPVTAQDTSMPPPVKKEAVSSISPLGVTPPQAQLSATICPQSHSQLIQQQTLPAAVAASAVTAASSPSSQQQVQTNPSQGVSGSQSSVLSAVSQAITPSANPTGRTLTIPSQGAVKLSLSSSSSTAGPGIPSGTHKVIIVSSTTPSILQRSLSVPVVKSLSTSAPSQSSSSTLVLNTAQQIQQMTNSASSGNADLTSNMSSRQVVSSNLPSKIQGKILAHSTPKVRPRANSIVIPVTPNQANTVSNVGGPSVQLKSALQSGKQGVLKSCDTAGLKILPLANINANSKLLQKASGSAPVYVVSTSSSASPTVSMVARTAPSGQRVMTFTSSTPKVPVSSSQGGNILSKPVQTLQLAQASSAVTSSASTSSKPNVIVVQKGSAAFGRAVTLAHSNKEVVGKVLLGGKALTSLNQNQTQSQNTLASSGNSTSNSPALLSQTAQTQPPSSHGSLPSAMSTPTRVVTVQKLPSSVVQGPAGSGNVIVLDLSQEQFNNSAVLNEILASSILQSSNVINFNHGTSDSSTSMNSLKGLVNFPTEQNDSDSGGQSSNGRSTQSSTSRVHTDICATAMSNANLNFNDFSDDSNLDDIQPISLKSKKTETATGTSNDPENNSNSGNTDDIAGNVDGNKGVWVPSESSLMKEDTEL